MLSSEVMAIDHSFKVAGQTVFSGLLTMTNEFSQIQVHVQKSTTQIELTILSLIVSMPNEEDSVMVVGLDSEWSVDLDAQHLSQNDHCQTAIIQLAYDNKIWIFQLITFLKNPHILKVGCNVKLDLQNLQEESGVDKPFPGGIDIVHFTKQKGIVKNAQIGLTDLCTKVLKLYYAVLDAWASLRVYEELEKMQIPGAVISFTPGHDIFLCQDDTNIIAQVTKVFVPGTILSTHWKQALSEFGTCPFTVVALCSWLKTYIPSFRGLETLTHRGSTSQGTSQLAATAESANNLANTEILNGELDQPLLSEGENGEADGTDTGFETGGPEQEGHSFEWLIIDFCDILASEKEDSSAGEELDLESVCNSDLKGPAFKAWAWLEEGLASSNNKPEP
ncbi:hypothetical protein ARMGADRAFT_1024617 [Armillaria gallica]|uniref:3'-5' exonuclease domain-containing protein n=1 Tax=Armillaria gallica TaxID=47427 RepID=A0A2H3E3H6_ARMGA|nr:hypothetical protein ARMGADRAFT_1024617 [Armillaria gallica]